TAFALLVIEGPEQGRTFVLDAASPSRILVGQSEVCDVRVGDRQVSRRHAAIELAGPNLHLVDLGSTNGTYVDGVRVIDAFLREGSILRMGATAMRVDRVASAPVASLPMAESFGPVIGASVEMRRLYPLCARLAASNVPVIIEGETGTGKEVLAEALHEQGPR